MANPARINITANGTYDVLLDPLQNPFSATVGVDLSNATNASYVINYTLSDFTGATYLAGAVVNANAAETVLWRADPTLGTAQTTSKTTTYSSPVYGVQIVLTGLTAGTVILEVLQGISTPA